VLYKIGGRFSLEDVAEKHLNFLYNFRVSNIRKQFFDDRAPNWSEHLAWYKDYVSNFDRLFVIFDNVHLLYIGTVGLIDYKIENRVVEFGRFGINNKAYLGKDYGFLILQSLFDYVFLNSNIEAIVCEVIAENRVLGLYVKLGFVVNGFEKDYICYPGRTINKVNMILTKERFCNEYRN